VAPHHLLFSTDDYQDLGGMIKINPPVRSPRERDELCALLAEQMIEVFATDHAPHTLEEKQKPLNLCPSGAPALELYYPLLFLLGERLNLDPSYMLKLGTENPATILSLHDRGHIKDGYHADFVVIERRPSSIDKNTVVSKCGWSPYCGLTFPVTVKGTYLAGRKMYGQNL
jgi:dihydroorotase